MPGCSQTRKFAFETFTPLFVYSIRQTTIRIYSYINDYPDLVDTLNKKTNSYEI